VAAKVSRSVSSTPRVFEPKSFATQRCPGSTETRAPLVPARSYDVSITAADRTYLWSFSTIDKFQPYQARAKQLAISAETPHLLRIAALTSAMNVALSFDSEAFGPSEPANSNAALKPLLRWSPERVTGGRVSELWTFELSSTHSSRSILAFGGFNE
jgi:hypothetical protein